jgi:RNA polymerase I-specific transcription initiation factor RRN7
MANQKWVDRRSLEEFFPLESVRDVDGNGETGVDRLKSDQRAWTAGVAMAGGHETGEAYSIYRSRDNLGALPEEMEMVISYGARFIGVDEEMILKVSEGYERRLWNWWGHIRRKGIEDRARFQGQVSDLISISI